MKYIQIIKNLMKEKKISQFKLSQIIGVNQTTVSMWLLGRKKPSYDNILAFYENFGITPNMFFGLEDFL